MRAAVLLLAVLTFLPCAAWSQGNPLGPEFRANTYTTSDQGVPSVAVSSSGDFVVVWASDNQDGLMLEVYAQRYASSGAPLGPEFRVNTFIISHQSWPSVAAESSGNFVVVWHSELQDGSLVGIFGQRYTSSGIPLGLEFRVNTHTTNDQRFPSVAVDSSGNFVVVWESKGQEGPAFGIFGQRYASSGAPLGPEFRVNTHTTGYQLRPSVAADSAGNFVVVWHGNLQDGSYYGVFGQRFASSGAPAGPEFRVNTHTSSFQFFPSVATDASGNFVVVWASIDQDGSSTGVFGQRFASTGAPLGPEFLVNSYTTSLQSDPSIASDPAGNFVVVWVSNGPDGSGRGVFGQRYLSSGIPIGPEFRVNTFTTDWQDYPSVAADLTGNFVVVWQSDGQDGSGYGVFGQRYRPILPVELMKFRVE